MLVAATKILAIKVGRSIDQPTCFVTLPAMFCGSYWPLEVEVEFLPINMP
jgi:hypothetical protein